MKVDVKIEDYEFELDFDRARELAKLFAYNFGDAMMLSWCNHVSKEWYPVAECCGEKSWETYANNRGSNLRITINSNYEFMFYVNQ